jgi:hypothetical protein
MCPCVWLAGVAGFVWVYFGKIADRRRLLALCTGEQLEWAMLVPDRILPFNAFQ